MIWFIPIPFIFIFTFRDLYLSGFPALSYFEGRNFLDWCVFLLTGLVVSSIISGACIGVGAIIGSNTDRIGIKDQEYALIALRQQDGFTGQFFLGSGMLQDRQYYFWYRKNNDGSIAGGKTTREPNVRIYQGNYEPHMVTFKTKYTSDFVAKWVWLFGLDARDDCDWLPDFYIPVGSIKEGFSL